MASSNVPPSAFLIVNTQVFPLKNLIVNIGRNLDNHLVIQELTVSSVHAQVRFENDQFVVYDLNSTNGTFLNGNKVTKSVLHSGDNIVLGGVPILFMQDTPQLARRSVAETGPLNPSGSIREPTTPKNPPDWLRDDN